jgi:Mn2+/Fe2+ NRAMP family transporter
MQQTSGIRWGRVILAAVLSEGAVFVVLLVVIFTHRYLLAPGRTTAEYDAFNDAASYYVAPSTAGVAAFFLALWVARKAGSAQVANGTMVGVIAVILSIGFVFLAKPEDRRMYGVSYALRLLGGYMGGTLAQRTSRHQESAIPGAE